jgi:glycine cleavage system transcriptional repressor
MFIVSAVGRDRPGMAHALAQALFEANCNLEDTTMTRLSGEFAMILIVSPPAALSIEALQQKLSTLESSHGLWVSLRDIGDEPPQSEKSQARFIVTAYGPDNTGLLARMARAFSEQNVNLTDVQTRVASNGGVYIMLFEVEAPPTLSEPDLRAAIESAASEIGVSATLRPLEEDVL